MDKIRMQSSDMTALNIKRTGLDLLFGSSLDWGMALSMSYFFEQSDDCTVHNYNDGYLIDYFNENVTESVFKETEWHYLLGVIFCGKSFANSIAKISVTEIFKQLVTDTHVKVL